MRGELEHLSWLAVHGGGNELADANCWRDTKPHLAALLEVAKSARFVDAQIEIRGGTVKRGRIVLPEPVALALLDLRESLTALASTSSGSAAVPAPASPGSRVGGNAA